MLKNVQENQSAAPETIAGLQSGVNSLLKLNVNDHVEKKNGLSYLSWAWAWDQALRADSNAAFNVRMFGEQCWMSVNGTAMVWVDVTMFGKTQTCFLPVMDYKNKPIPNPDAFQINTALMRCLTKCLAMFGLGLYIYAGEDLPLESGEERKDVVEVKEVKEEKTEVSSQEVENLTLFADGLINYLNVATDEKGLKSYWKSNQTSIDKLKAAMPDLYTVVLNKFKETKESFNKEQ